MQDEIALLVKRAEHKGFTAQVNTHGWKLPPRPPGRVRLALAHVLVTLAVRLAPTITLPQMPAKPRTASDFA